MVDDKNSGLLDKHLDHCLLRIVGPMLVSRQLQIRACQVAAALTLMRRLEFSNLTLQPHKTGPRSCINLRTFGTFYCLIHTLLLLCALNHGTLL